MFTCSPFCHWIALLFCVQRALIPYVIMLLQLHLCFDTISPQSDLLCVHVYLIEKHVCVGEKTPVVKVLTEACLVIPCNLTGVMSALFVSSLLLWKQGRSRWGRWLASCRSRGVCLSLQSLASSSWKQVTEPWYVIGKRFNVVRGALKTSTSRTNRMWFSDVSWREVALFPDS